MKTPFQISVCHTILGSAIHRLPVAGQTDSNMDSGIQMSEGSASELSLRLFLFIHLLATNDNTRETTEVVQLLAETEKTILYILSGTLA